MQERIMKKTILASLIATFLSTSALADTSSMNSSISNMGILENSYIRAGVNGTAGTFGSGGNTSPGLLFDSTGTGTFNTSYDYLTPGTPFDGFSVKINSTNYTNNNAGGLAITGDGNGLTDGANSLSWTGGVASVFNITNTYSLGATSPYIDVTSRITMGTAATDVWFAHFIDPDARAAAGDSSRTDNVLGYGVIPSTNVAFSEALSSRYALGIYSTDTNVDAGITGWTTDADSYTYNRINGDGVLTNSGDNTIGLSWHWSSVASGDILTASYAYIFGPSAFTAANTAITGGAGGGNTTTTSSWGTLTDVGSATAAASGSSTPTLVSTGTTTYNDYGTWSAWTTNTALPVLTQSQTTHDASDDGKVQTIDRETTTIVTTPEKRTRTYDVKRDDTWTDGIHTETVSTGNIETAYQNTAVTTVTDPGSFTGRIDQMSTLEKTHNSLFRTIIFNGVNIIGADIDHANGMSGELKGLAVGGSRDLDNGWSIGAGLGALTAKVSGVDGSGTADTNLFNLHAEKRVEKGVFEFGITHAATDYAVTRTIGTFANEGASKGTDTWVNLQFAGNGEHFRPVFGVVSGQRKTDAYTETGSIQSARTVASVKESYTEGVVGAQVTAGPVTAELLHYTDSVNSLNIALTKQIGKDKTVYVAAQRVESDFNSTNSVRLGLNIKF